MIRSITIGLIVCLFVMAAKAQRVVPPSRWDVRVNVAYGKPLLSITSNLDIHSTSNSFYSGGLQVDYYFQPRLGFGFGADYVKNDFEIALSNYSNTVYGNDNWDGDTQSRPYEFYIGTNHTDVVEAVSLTMVEVPLSLVYRYPITKRINLVGRGGLTIAFPIKSSYTLKESNLRTQLYFKEWDLLLFDIPAHGLYNSRTDWHPSGELNTNLVASLFGEIGIGFPFARVFHTRFSLYGSFGLNNLANDKQSSLIYWREYYNNLLSLASHTSLMQMGLKLSIGLNKNKKPRMTTNEYNCPGCTWVKEEERKRRMKPQ